MSIQKKCRSIFALALAAMLGGCAAVSAAPAEQTLPELRTAVYYMDTLPEDLNAGAQQSGGFLTELTTTAFYTIGDGALADGLADIPEDVTGEYAGSYGIPAGAQRGYAFRIALDEGVYWDDGTPVTADDVLAAVRLEDHLWIANAEEYLSGHERPTGDVISLHDAGFDTAAAAREAGYTRFYVDLANLWGLEAGWESVTDRTRIRDYAMPDGLNELYITAAYIYRNYLTDGSPLDDLQSEFLGVTRSRADVLTREDVGLRKTGDHEILVITRDPAAPRSVAVRLAQLRLTREAGGSYGPYRIAESGKEQIVLERNACWQGDVSLYPADVILCKPR